LMRVRGVAQSRVEVREQGSATRVCADDARRLRVPQVPARRVRTMSAAKPA